jgi:hypothetical protein
MLPGRTGVRVPREYRAPIVVRRCRVSGIRESIEQYFYSYTDDFGGDAHLGDSLDRAESVCQRR